VQKFLKFSTLSLLVILLTFIQVSAEEDILLELTVGEGDLLMYFVDGDNEYILEPSSISFETSNTSFDPVDVEGTFGVSSQKLRIDNATGGEVELSVALDVSDFAADAKWLDGENSFLAYSTNGSTGGLVVDPEDVVLTDSGCGGVTNDRTLSRFTYLGSEDPGNVTSIDVLNSSGGNYCRFDITNLKLIQTIPPRTSSGNYVLGMILTLTAGEIEGSWRPWSCGDIFVDPRDEQEYKTVKIGNQCWMQENLNYQDHSTGSSWCYGNNSGNCAVYGRLYNWAAAMNGDSVSDGVTDVSVQGVCPNDWSLPSDSDWHILELTFTTGSCDSSRTDWSCIPAGSRLAGNYNLWPSGNLRDHPAFGESKFDVLPGGYRFSGGSFDYIESRASLWSSSPTGSDAWRRSFFPTNSGVGRVTGIKTMGCSVRCLKD
jgi:uncharacterized protein (TIGR02145 family)